MEEKKKNLESIVQGNYNVCLVSGYIWSWINTPSIPNELKNGKVGIYCHLFQMIHNNCFIRATETHESIIYKCKLILQISKRGTKISITGIIDLWVC